MKILLAVVITAFLVSGCSHAPSSQFYNSCGTIDPMTSKCLTSPWISGYGAGDGSSNGGGP